MTKGTDIPRPRFARLYVKAAKTAEGRGATEHLEARSTHKRTIFGRLVRALFRTRTGDPFLTMEVLYQLS